MKEQIKKMPMREHYAALGIDVDKAIEKLKAIPISFIVGKPTMFRDSKTRRRTYRKNQATGNYPGKAHTIEELRKDIEKVLSLIRKTPISLHAIYGDLRRICRSHQIEAKHFQSWIDWAKIGHQIGFQLHFSLSKADNGYTLSDFDRKSAISGRTPSVVAE